MVMWWGSPWGAAGARDRLLAKKWAAMHGELIERICTCTIGPFSEQMSTLGYAFPYMVPHL
eukprot:43121-Chlamydomonas_euryale.AAC.3